MLLKQFSPFILGTGEKDKVTSDVLSEHLFSAPTSMEWFSQGFVSPTEHSDPDNLVFKVQGSLQIALQKEDKVLPNSVINDFLKDKVLQIEAEECRTVGRKEKQGLKEEIVGTLLPKAFTKKSVTRSLVTDRFLLINKASATQAEAFLSALRQTLGGLNASLPRTQLSLSTLMTDWLARKEAAGQFVLDSECELKAAGEAAAIVRVSRQDLTSDELSAHLQNKTVTKLGLIWADRIRFVLNSDMTFTKIQFLDVLQEEISDEGEDKETLLAATQLICVRELESILSELIELLGGLEK